MPRHTPQRADAAVLALALALVAIRPAAGQTATAFLMPGTVELGGGLSMTSQTEINNGRTASGSVTLLALSPYVGVFVAKGVELGVYAPQITWLDDGYRSQTQVALGAAPAYHFSTDGPAFPYLEAQLGYNFLWSHSDGSYGVSTHTDSEFSWALGAGVKVILGRCVLRFGLLYSEVSLMSSGANARDGINTFAAQTGFGLVL